MTAATTSHERNYYESHVTSLDSSTLTATLHTVYIHKRTSVNPPGYSHKAFIHTLLNEIHLSCKAFMHTTSVPRSRGRYLLNTACHWTQLQVLLDRQSRNFKVVK